MRATKETKNYNTGLTLNGSWDMGLIWDHVGIQLWGQHLGLLHVCQRCVLWLLRKDPLGGHVVSGTKSNRERRRNKRTRKRK